MELEKKMENIDVSDSNEEDDIGAGIGGMGKSLGRNSSGSGYRDRDREDSKNNKDNRDNKDK